MSGDELDEIRLTTGLQNYQWEQFKKCLIFDITPTVFPELVSILMNGYNTLLLSRNTNEFPEILQKKCILGIRVRFNPNNGINKKLHLNNPDRCCTQKMLCSFAKHPIIHDFLLVIISLNNTEKKIYTLWHTHYVYYLLTFTTRPLHIAVVLYLYVSCEETDSNLPSPGLKLLEIILCDLD